jgi:hypothetical protein
MSVAAQSPIARMTRCTFRRELVLLSPVTTLLTESVPPRAFTPPRTLYDPQTLVPALPQLSAVESKDVLYSVTLVGMQDGEGDGVGVGE